jgi:hypothetical protein
MYPWGKIDIFDESLSDFKRLQRLLFESNKVTVMRDATQEMSIALFCKKNHGKSAHIQQNISSTDVAAYLLLVIGGNTSPSAGDIRTLLGLSFTPKLNLYLSFIKTGAPDIEENDERIDAMISDFGGKTLPEVLINLSLFLDKIKILNICISYSLLPSINYLLAMPQVLQKLVILL